MDIPSVQATPATSVALRRELLGGAAERDVELPLSERFESRAAERCMYPNVQKQYKLAVRLWWENGGATVQMATDCRRPEIP